MIQQQTSGAEQIAGILRSVASKRKHGTLEVSASPFGYEIGFQNGRIVSVATKDAPLVEQVCDRLIRAGYLSASMDLSSVFEIRDLRQCLEHLEEEFGISRDVFIQALHAHQLDILHSIRNAEVFGSDFKAIAVNIDPMFALSLSAGQLLLDLVEVDSDNERFQELFGRNPDTVMVRKNASVPPSSQPTVEILWRMIEAERAVRDLIDASLRSEHEVKAFLLAMVDAKAISVYEQSNNSPRSAMTDSVSSPKISQGGSEWDEMQLGDGEPLESGLFERIEEEDDEMFDLLSMNSTQGEEQFKAETPGVTGSSAKNTAATDPVNYIPHTVRLQNQPELPLSRPPITDIAAIARSIPEPDEDEDEYLLDIPDTSERRESPSVAAQSVATQKQNESSGSFRKLSIVKIAGWNYLLREEHGLRLIGVFVTAVILVWGAAILPTSIRHFLSALTNVSSSPLPWKQFLE